VIDPVPNPTAAEDDVLITRVFDAPRKAVFAAWTDPRQIARWYGPERLEVPFEDVHVDLCVGGRFELVMVDREAGRRYPLRYEIVELVVPELLVLRCPAMPEMGVPHDVLTRVELHDHGDKTRMTLSDGPYPSPGRDGAAAGWSAAVEKLADLVAVSG
jgi:uncharacterized protein YndB with AHSA1/START domain